MSDLFFYKMSFEQPAFIPVMVFMGLHQISGVYVPPLVYNLHDELIPENTSEKPLGLD